MLNTTRRQRRLLRRENESWPEALRHVPKVEWPASSLPPDKHPIEVWRSRDFFVQVYLDKGVERLSVMRTAITGNDWEDNITWEEMQRLKAECGRGDYDAVEIYPADKDVVNVANMRHIFVLPQPFPLTWRNVPATETV